MAVASRDATVTVQAVARTQTQAASKVDQCVNRRGEGYSNIVFSISLCKIDDSSYIIDFRIILHKFGV